MSERRAAAKGRRLGSSRRKQLQESSREASAPAPGPGQEPPWASEVVQRVQHFLSSRDMEQAGFVTQQDIQKLQEEGFPCSTEELELVFHGLDAAGTGRVGTEEFTAGLRQFLSSQKAVREHRRRKTASRRVRLVIPSPALEGVDSEERRHFAAFMEQLGTDNISEEQEIWQLWVKLRQDEPQLLDNLEGFLAKMRHRIQDARSKKEALELTLNKRVAEHDKDVQQLCEALEQQIQQEQLRLQQQSVARSHQQGEELQRMLDASEREVQRLVSAQVELERRCRSLHSSQQITSTENQQLQESNQALEDHLQHLHQQLQHTQGRLRTMRATVAWEQRGEPRDRVVAELPIEVPTSPQLSPGKSEKFRSEMRIRLGSQSGESKAKSTHQVVWEMLPAEISLSGVPQKASSAEENPFPESLKEERFSDQSSLLREMNDAIAALTKHLKAQAPGALPAPTDTPCHPWDDAEPQTGPEAATARGTTPEVLQENLPGHVHHELLEGDLQEGEATAELPDVTQAGASTGAGQHTAQEPGAEQGESPGEAQRMLFLQGKGTGVEEMVLNVAEHLGESTEAGEQVLMEVEGAGAGWMQEKTGWEKPQLLGEAEKVEINQGENLEAGLGPPETEQEGVAVGQSLAREELQEAGIPGECVQGPDTALQEWAEPSSGLPEKLQTELGEHLQPEPPSWGEAQVEAARGDGVPEVTVTSGPGMLQEEFASAEVQPRGETANSKVLEVLPAPAEHAGSSRDGGEEEEVEEAEPREAEQQLQGECARGGAGWAGSSGIQELLAAAVPPTLGQEGGVGTDVELLEAQSSDTNVAEVEADLQLMGEAGSPGTQQVGGVDPGVQLEKEDKTELGLGEEMGAAAVHSEGPSPAEVPVGSPDLCGLLPVKSQALELVEADLQLCGELSPGTPQGGKSGRDIQLQEDEEEDGAQEQGEHGLQLKPVPYPDGVTLGKGWGAGEGLQLQEKGESLDSVEESSGANVQLIAELRVTPGGSTEADLQLRGEAGSPGTEHRGRLDSEVQLLDQVNKAELVEVEEKDAQEGMQLSESLNSGFPWGGEIGTDGQIEEEENGAQGQGECELSHEPVLDLQGSGVRQGEGAAEDMQAQGEAESLNTTEEQSSDANVQLIAEEEELRVTPGGSTEADLQPLGGTDSPGTEQGGSVVPDVHSLDQVDKTEVLEMKVEDVQEDTMFHEGLSPGGPWGGQCGTDAHPEEEEHDGAQGQGEFDLSHKPVLDLQGAGVGQGEGSGADLQAGKEAESLDMLEDQSTDANMQLITERDELKSASGESTEPDLQLLSVTDSQGTEQGGNVAPDVHPLEQVGEAESVEMEAEDSWRDTQLCGGASPETPQAEGDSSAVQPRDGAGDWGQGEHGLGQELVPHPSAVSIRQRRETDAAVQLWDEIAMLDTVEDQSSGANVQLIAEQGELRVTPGGSTEADLQLGGEAESPGTEQGGSVDSEVQPLEQVNKAELVEVEVVDGQADLQLCESLSPGAPWGGEGGTALQMEKEEEDGRQEQGEHGLPHEPVSHPEGVILGQEEGAGAGLQARQEAQTLDTVEDQSSDASVQLIAEQGELRVTPGGSTEADLQLGDEAGSPGTEQGGSVDSEVQLLDQVNEAELVEVEAEDAQADLQLCESLSSGVPWGGEIGTDVHLEEEENEAQGQGECELSHEPVLDLQGSGVRQGEGAAEDMQAQGEAESLNTIEEQSSDANVQLTAEEEELRVTPGGSTEADLQPLGGTDSPGTEQGGSVVPDVHSLDQVDKTEVLEMKAEDVQEDTMFYEGLSPGGPWGGQCGTDAHPEEEEHDGAQGRGEFDLSHKPVLDLQGAGVGQGEGSGADLQAGKEAESLDMLEDQSTDANMQLIAGRNELKSASGESTEPDLQLLSVTDSQGTEQGGNVAPDVHPLEQVGEAESVEMEAEDSWRDTQLCGGASPETPQAEGDSSAVQPRDGAGDWGQGEHGLGQELVPHPSAVSIRQRRETDAAVQPWDEIAMLDTVEDQSSGANVQLIAEQGELRVTPGGSTEADLQLGDEAGSPGTEQGGSVDSEVQPLEQVNKAELVEVEVVDGQADLQLCESLSPGAPWGGEGETALQMEKEEEDGRQEQGEHGLPHEPVSHPEGVILGQEEGAGAGLQARQEAQILDTVEDQSSGANVQLIAEQGELRVTPGGSTEADLQVVGQAGSPGTEQQGSVDSEVQPLEQFNKAELVEVEAEDAQADLQLLESLSSGVPWGGEIGTDVHLEEEENGAQGQGECGLSHEPVLDLQGSGVRQGEGAAEDMQAQGEAESLNTIEEQSSDANVQLTAEQGELRVTPGGSTEADLQLRGEAGSPGTEQGGSVDSEVQPLDQFNKAELVEVEAEDAQADLQLCESLSSGVPWGGEIGTDVHLEEEENEAQRQGECELSHEPVLDLQGSGVRQGEGAAEDMQAQGEAESLNTIEEQSSDANVQLTAEEEELRVTPGGSTEADLQPLGGTDSPGTEQGGSVAPDVHSLDQVDKTEVLEMKAEDVQEDTMFHEGLSPGGPWGRQCGADAHPEEKEEEEEEEQDGAQGQGECDLSHKPVLDLQGAGVGQGEGSGADLQAGKEAESLDMLEDQSTDANMQLITERDELKSASGESIEADLQLLSVTDSQGTEQGGNVAPDVHPLEQVGEAESVEMEAEDSWRDTQLCGGASPETPQAEGDSSAVQPRDGAGDWGQGEHGLGQELVPHPSAVSIRQRRETDAAVQLWDEIAMLDTVEDQSSGANVQLIAEQGELRVTPGGSTEADLQVVGQAGSPGTEQGGSVDSEVQPLEQFNKAELVEVEAEDAQADLQLLESLSSGVPWGGEIGTDVHLEEEENGAQGQGECELSHEPVLDLQGSGVRQGEGAAEDMQAQGEAESLNTIEEQSSDANVQLTAEQGELRVTPGGSTEADLQLRGEAGSPGTEQQGSVDSEVQLLDQVNKAELVEVEGEDAQEDMQLCESLRSGVPWGGETGTEVQIEEEEEEKKEDGAQGQGECELSHEPVLHLQGSRVGQTEGTGAGVQLWEEAERLDTTEDQSSDVNVQLLTEGNELKSASGESLGSQRVGEGRTAIQIEEDEEDGAQGQGEHALPQESVLDPQGAGHRQGEGAEAGLQPQEKAESLDTLEAQSTDADVQLEQQELRSGSGGSREADLTPLGVAGMWEGQQSLTPGLEAGLGAAPTADPWEGAAAAHVVPPAEAALCPEPVTAAEGPGLEAKLGTCSGPEGQILEDTQALESLQAERAAAEGKPLDGAHSLEVAQGERLEAGVRNAGKTQGLGLNQGHDDAVPALASLVSEVPAQSSTLKLETMMQEDVLIPDVWRLCAPGQAAQGEIQEQVSAQGHEGRLPTTAPQLDRETPHAMEPEHAAAEPAGPPKQEVPSASALHMTVQPEGAGSEQLGMILRDNSLGQRQPLGEQRKDVSVGQREKMQEFGQKMSQEGEPSPAEPGAVTTGGAGDAQRGCPKAAQDPDHLYNVLFVGDSHVGKTSFLYRLHADTFNPHLSATVGLDYQIKNLVVDNKRFALRLWDSAGQERYRSMTKQFFRKADGVVLMYDITSEYSFSDVRYWLSCIQEAAEDGVAVLLLGNKTDCAAQRQVPTKEGECLAKEHQLMFYECSAASGHNVFESMVSFIRLLKGREDELKNKAEEVPKAPQKKKGCCW